MPVEIAYLIGLDGKMLEDGRALWHAGRPTDLAFECWLADFSAKK